MSNIKIVPIEKLGYDFIDEKYIPEGKDEYYLRDLQFNCKSTFRPLKAREIEELIKNGNTSDDWANISVTDSFTPALIKNSSFLGKVRIEKLEPCYIEYHDFTIPVGIYNSHIISCDLGANVSITNVDYISHYIIRKHTVIFNVNEISMSNHAKFGNGVVMDDEKEDVRIHLEVANETGARSILPFDQLLTPDAYIWQKFRGDQELMNRLKEITQNTYITKRGYYGVIESFTVIKNCRLIKDCKIGSHAYIKGCNKLKNLTIKSNEEAPTQIGEGVELVNGIISEGCRVFYGVKAVRFQLMPHAQLKYGARLINSVLGCNSTISCCEVLNSLIFPGHEQHHNSSFLIAAVVKGQSNIASGATIGSNHNSRGNDGEIVAGRGFWPGLTVNLSHNSRFASYTLIAKGSYKYEINNPFPFALLSQTSKGGLRVLPGYWLLYNMYALARNSWKYKERDKRIVQNVLLEFDYLAPDTVEEMRSGIGYLKKLAEKSWEKQSDKKIPGGELLKDYEKYGRFPVTSDAMENRNPAVLIDHPDRAVNIYEDMINYYCIKTLCNLYMHSETISLSYLREYLKRYKNIHEWDNIGGQLILKEELREIIRKIKTHEISSWPEIHDEYKKSAMDYRLIKALHALSTLLHQSHLNLKDFKEQYMDRAIDRALETNEYIRRKTRETREKDYTNPFRKITYDDREEMEAVLGRIDDNEFIKYTDKVCDKTARNFEIFREIIDSETIYDLQDT